MEVIVSVSLVFTECLSQKAQNTTLRGVTPFAFRKGTASVIIVVILQLEDGELWGLKRSHDMSSRIGNGLLRFHSCPYQRFSHRRLTLMLGGCIRSTCGDHLKYRFPDPIPLESNSVVWVGPKKLYCLQAFSIVLVCHYFGKQGL